MERGSYDRSYGYNQAQEDIMDIEINTCSAAGSSSVSSSQVPLQPTPRKALPLPAPLAFSPNHASSSSRITNLIPVPPLTPSGSIFGVDSTTNLASTTELLQRQQQERGPLTPAASPRGAAGGRLWGEEEDGGSAVAVGRTESGYVGQGEGSGGSKGMRMGAGTRTGGSEVWGDSAQEGVGQIDPQTLISAFQALPNAQRFAFLSLLVPSLRMDEALVVSRKIEPRLKRDFLRELPGELALHCLSFITDAHTLVLAARVSKHWYSLLQDEQTWKDMCEWHRFTPIVTPLSLSRNRSRQQHHRPSVSQRQRNLRRIPLPNSSSASAGGGSGADNTRERWKREHIGGLGIRGMGITSEGDEAGRREDQYPHDMPGSMGTTMAIASSSRSGGSPNKRPEYYIPMDIPLGPHPLLQKDRDKGKEREYSFKTQFKNAYMTQRNWLHGGRALKQYIAVNEDDGVVTSLAVNNHYMVVGMANSRIHVFDAATARYKGTLIGHALGVWTLVLVSPLEGDESESDDDEEGEEESSDSAYGLGPGLAPRGGPSRPQFRNTSASASASNPNAHPISHSARTFAPIGLDARGTSSGGLGGPSTTSNLNQYQRLVQLQQYQTYRDDGMTRRASTGAGMPEAGWGIPPTDASMSMGAGRESIHTYHPPNIGEVDVGVGADAEGDGEVDPAVYPAGGVRYPSNGIGGSTSAGIAEGGGDAWAWGINRPNTASGSTPTPGLHPGSDFGQSRAGPGGYNRHRPESGIRIPAEEQAEQSGRSRSARRIRMRSSEVCGSARGWGTKGSAAAGSTRMGGTAGMGGRHLVVSGGCDRAVKVWDVATGACIYTLPGHGSTIRCLKVLDRRPIAISGSRDASLRVWDIQAGRQLRMLQGHEGSVRCLEVAGNRAVSGSYDNTARIWNVDTGECLHVLRGHYHQIYACAFDGERVITGSLDSTVRIWSAATGECLAMLQGHTSLVGQIQFSGSNRLVTGGSDGRVIIFDLSTYECLHRLCAHDNSVTCLQFDDRYIISGGMDGRVKLWDTRTGTFLRELTQPCTSVWRIGFIQDRVIILCQRNGKTVLEVLTFRPGDAMGRRLTQT